MIVSGGASDRARDLVTKRREYAAAGIPEYWIVDPDAETVAVLRLKGDGYEERVLGRGEIAESPLLKGFEVAVAEVLDAE